MFIAAVAQLRFAFALASGRPIPGWALDRLVAEAAKTAREFGPLGADGAEGVTGPTLDPEARRTVQLHRFRSQAKRAAAETGFYSSLFRDLEIEPGSLDWEGIAGLPLTSKDALRADPDAFVRRGARPFLRAATTGTTGTPTRVAFSAAELRTMAGLSALAFLFGGQLGPEDVVLKATSTRAMLSNVGVAGACLGTRALLQPVGLIEPAATLALLAEGLRLPGRKPKVSWLSTYPSYLGQLVETGLALGYRPSDFGLERIAVGGEIVTEGVKRRARRLFGDVRFEVSYGMTETLPLGGTVCEQGHLHFEPSHGLMEIVGLDGGGPAGPDEAGTMVATPFPPFRETTLLLRYDTEDVVRALPESLTCLLRHQPATSDLLGKRRLAVHHEEGWTFPRQILEALEAVDAVPLPARCGFWAVPGGVAVEVAVGDDGPLARGLIERSLGEQGVPVRDLRLVTDPAELRHPLPMRCDLREASFVTDPRRAVGEVGGPTAVVAGAWS
ncbi:MAG: phenylacetate--CoA ligase family protein [Thermomicrobiales bacterium]